VRQPRQGSPNGPPQLAGIGLDEPEEAESMASWKAPAPRKFSRRQARRGVGALRPFGHRRSAGKGSSFQLQAKKTRRDRRPIRRQFAQRTALVDVAHQPFSRLQSITTTAAASEIGSSQSDLDIVGTVAAARVR